MRRSCLALTACLALAFGASSRAEASESSWSFGLGGGAVMPSASFADHADAAPAFELFVCWHAPDRPFGVRLTGHWSQYAHSDTTYALPGISVDTRTSSDFWLVTLGPELMLGGDRRARFLVHAGLGVARASTRTSTRNFTNDVGETNHGDGALALEGGTAIVYDILPWRGFAAELGARWMRTGELDYVPDVGVHRAAGQLVLTNTHGSLDAVILRAALTIAIQAKNR